MKKALISIIMPAHNAEKTLKRAVDSVLSQKFEDWELLIIDDASKDHTAKTAKEFAEKDERIKFFLNKKNLGVAGARNFGIKNAKAPFVAFLDSDDFWEEDKLEEQIKVLSTDENCGICFTSSKFIYEDGKCSGYIFKAPEKVTAKELLLQNVISCSSVLVRKRDLLKHPMPENKMLHEDYAVWLSILKDYPYAAGIEKPLLVYQISAKSKSGNKIKAAKMQWNTYCYCKVPFAKAVVSFFAYTVKSLKKYKAIHSGM